MTYKLASLLLGFTEDYAFAVFNIVVAVWFFAVGYLLVKHAGRRARARVAEGDGAVSATSLLDAAQGRALLHG